MHEDIICLPPKFSSQYSQYSADDNLLFIPNLSSPFCS